MFLVNLLFLFDISVMGILPPLYSVNLGKKTSSFNNMNKLYPTV